jgi:hypothetical protein
MGKGLIGLSAAALVLGLSGNAHAGFQFNYTITPGTGPLAGKNVFNFYARNDQQGGQAGSKGLIAIDAHFVASQAFTFDLRDVDADGLTDVNVFGIGFDQTNAGSTFMRLGGEAKWFGVLPKDSVYRTGGGAVNPAQNFANVTDFRGVGIIQGGNTDVLDATQGLGLYYGTAVVPAGVDVNVNGQVAAEKGSIVGTPSEPLDGDGSVRADGNEWPILAGAPSGLTQGPDFFFNFTATAPEPAALGVIGAAALGLTTRRRARRAGPPA